MAFIELGQIDHRRTLGRGQKARPHASRSAESPSASKSSELTRTIDASSSEKSPARKKALLPPGRPVKWTGFFCRKPDRTGSGMTPEAKEDHWASLKMRSSEVRTRSGLSVPAATYRYGRPAFAEATAGWPAIALAAVGKQEKAAAPAASVFMVLGFHRSPPDRNSRNRPCVAESDGGDRLPLGDKTPKACSF